MTETYDLDTMKAIIKEARLQGFKDDVIAGKLNIDRDHDGFWLAAIEAERDADPNYLRAGQRIRCLVPSVFGWQGCGTMTMDQDGDLIWFQRDGDPDIDNPDECVFCRDQVVPVSPLTLQ